MHTLICFSRGDNWYSSVIVFFTTILIRRMKLSETNSGWFKSFFLMLASVFGIGALAKVKAKYNHAFLAFKSNDFKKWMCIDVVQNGVTIIPLRRAIESCREIKSFDCKITLWDGVLKTDNALGKEYDWLGIIGTGAIVVYYAITGHMPDRLTHSKGRYFCSEYVSAVLRKSFSTKFNRIDDMYPDLLEHELANDAYFYPVDLDFVISQYK